MQILLQYIMFSGGIVCFIVSLIVWYYYMALQDKPSTASIRISSMTAIAFYCICCFSTSYRLSLFDSNSLPSGTYQWSIAYLNFGSWRGAQTLTYIIFIQRLKYSFSTTKYASKSSTYTFLYILSVLFMAIEIAKDLFVETTSPQSNIIDTIVFYEFIISGSVDMALTIVLLYLFMKKLYALNKDIAFLYNVYCKNTSTINEEHYNKYMRINHIIAKITIVSTFSSISTQILMALFSIEFYFQNKESDNATLILSEIWMVFWTLDCVINSICIFWSFDFALNYYLCVCSSCQTLCVKCCISCTLQKGDQNNYNSNMISYHKLTEKDVSINISDAQ